MVTCERGAVSERDKEETVVRLVYLEGGAEDAELYEGHVPEEEEDEEAGGDVGSWLRAG